MWPYWMMFLIPAFAAAQERPRTQGAHMRSAQWGLWLCVGIALTLLLGLRHEVGGDWGNYLRNLHEIRHYTIYDVLIEDDPGYGVLQWIAKEAGWGIYGVNVISAAIFSIGVISFSRERSRPWLALAASVPYLVIVLGMGYSRQGVAIGLMMIGLVGLGQNRVLYFVFWVVLASLFHKSAVLMLPMAALAASRRRLTTMIWVGAIAAIAYVLLVQESLDDITKNYIDAEYESRGALVRLLMNAIPAALLIAMPSKFENIENLRLWRWYSIASLALFAAYFLSPSSTLVDRLGLYLLPLQIVVLSRLPEAISLKKSGASGIVLSECVYLGITLFIWLNYGVNSQYWIPYKNLLLL